MANGIDKAFMEQLKSKTDTVQVIGSYIPVKKNGGNHWACCPFHHERTPSFSINQDGQFYHCFGCHTGGDVIKFVQEYESLSFIDAVRLLAEKAGMEVPESSYDAERVAKERREKDRALSMMKETARFYAANLHAEVGTPFRTYLLSRGVDEKAMKRFGLGASPDFESLISYLNTKGYTREEMLKAGVAGEKNGRVYDALGGRLIVPVINQMGEVVAFGGRLMEQKPKFAKYKNTQETDLFQKRKTLYNLNLVKKLKNEKGLNEIVVVEGYMDTISLYCAGFCNVVASMGTALTSDQARMIKRYVDTVIISYDGDFAGQNATLRGLEILESEGLKVKVAVMPEGLDPDDVIRKQGAEAYRKILNDSLPLIDFKLLSLKRKYDLTTTDGRRDYLGEALEIVRNVKDNFVKEDLLKTLREDTGISYESLYRDADRGAEKKKKEEPVPMQVAAPVSDAGTSATRFILYSLLTGKKFAKQTDVEELEFTHPVHRMIADYLYEKFAAGASPNASMLYDVLEKNDHAELDAIFAESSRDGQDYLTAKKYYEDCVKTVKRAFLQSEINALTKAFKHETDTEKRKELAVYLQKRTVQLKKLS